MQNLLNELGLEVSLSDDISLPLKTVSVFPVTTFLCRLMLNTSISVGSLMRFQGITVRESREKIIDAAKYFNQNPGEMPASAFSMVRALIAVTEMFNEPDLVFTEYIASKNLHSFTVMRLSDGGGVSPFGTPFYLAGTPHYSNLSDFSSHHLDVFVNGSHSIIDVVSDNGQAFQISQETFETVFFPLYIDRLDPDWATRTRVISNYIKHSSQDNRSLGL